MCAQDSNKGARQAAKIENERKWFEYGQKSKKYFNKETRWLTRKAEIGRGSSVKASDNYSAALYATGLGRQHEQQLKKDMAQLSTVSGKTGVARSSRYGFTKYKQILDKQAAIENSINNTWGRQMAQKDQQLINVHRRMTAKNRQALGESPMVGFPVMMPPKAGDAGLKNLQMGLSIIGTAAPFFAMSDRKLKENIEEVGVSNIGYKIYEWNYKSIPNTRYRGVIAQDVVKINPMAVGIMPNGYLGVYYDKVDVDMEVV